MRKFYKILFLNNIDGEIKKQSNVLASISKKASIKVSFFDYKNANEFLDIISGVWKEGNAGAVFLPIGRHTAVAEKMAEDLFVSNDETLRRYAASLTGYIESPKKHLFVTFYRAEKLFYDSLPIGDNRRNNSHQIIEDLIISTAIRFDLVYMNNKRANRLNSDWINFLFEVVSDAVNEYKWRSFPLALTILSFHYYKKDWFKVLLAKYGEYIAQSTDEAIQTHRDLYDEIKRRNGETELFENLLNHVVVPRLNAATNWKSDYHIENKICGVIDFYNKPPKPTPPVTCRNLLNTAN